MPIETKPFEAEKYFRTPEAQARLLTEALESGDVGFIAASLGVVAKARGITKVAADTGLTRQTLYSALAKGGNPRLDTIVRVLDALDLKLSVAAKDVEHA